LLSAPQPVEPAAATQSPTPYIPQPARQRPVFDPGSGEFVSVAIYDRASLSPGARIAGPAIIVEDETSTVVTRLFDAAIDAFGYIELTRRAS
jgi:N-methylhydantoinase A